MEPDLPSDSDASDEDYRPSGGEESAASEDESGVDDVPEDNDDNDETQNENGQILKRRKKSVKKKNLKRKLPPEEILERSDGESSKEEILSPEEEKKKADTIWADFLKDCDEPQKKKQSVDNGDSSNISSNTSSRNREIKVNNEPKTVAEEKENKQTVTQVFEFAGETVRVEKEVATSPVRSDVKPSTNGASHQAPASGRGRGSTRGRGGSALSSFLGQIGKKGKLSVLEKSKLDWDQFKKTEGITEDISQHNKGKDGYLERQDFLQRTDLRRFEIEKAMRQKRSGR